MIYLPDSRLAIYEVPKTGTEWTRQALKKLGIRHRIVTPEQAGCRQRVSIRHGLPEHFPSLTPRYEVCTVRHPLKWLESWYRFQTKHQWRIWEPGCWHPQRAMQRVSGATFKGFIERYLASCPGAVSAMFKAYAEDCNAVMLQETLSDDLASVLSGAGYEVEGLEDVPVCHQSPKYDVKLSPGLVNAVCQSDAETIDRWYF